MTSQSSVTAANCYSDKPCYKKPVSKSCLLCWRSCLRNDEDGYRHLTISANLYAGGRCAPYRGVFYHNPTKMLENVTVFINLFISLFNRFVSPKTHLFAASYTSRDDENQTKWDRRPADAITISWLKFSLLLETVVSNQSQISERHVKSSIRNLVHQSLKNFI